MSFHSDLFGWDYVWRNFAEQKGGEAIDVADGSGLAGLAIPVPGTKSAVVFTPFVHHGRKRQKGTTVMTSYKPADDFVFSIQTEKLTDQVGKVLGLQDVQVQDQQFDGKYLIRGNDERRIQMLFADEALREAILLQAPTQLRIETDPSHFDPEWTVPAGHHVLVYRYDHLMEKLDQLQIAFDVLTTASQRLAALRTTHSVAPAASTFAPEVEEEEEQPVQTTGRLHSPLLDRA